MFIQIYLLFIACCKGKKQFKKIITITNNIKYENNINQNEYA